VAELHPVYYDDPVARLVFPASVASTPTAGGDPPQVTVDPPNTYLGTLRVSVTASDGTGSDTEAFSVQVSGPGAGAPDLAAIADQAMTSDQLLDVALSVYDSDTPAAGLTYTASADDYGYVLDQTLSLVSYSPNFDNTYGAGEKWLQDSAGEWYLIHLDGAGQAFLRKWDGGGNVTDGQLVAQLHRAYYDDPAGRLVFPASIASTLTAAGDPPLVTLDFTQLFPGEHIGNAVALDVMEVDRRGGDVRMTCHVSHFHQGPPGGQGMGTERMPPRVNRKLLHPILTQDANRCLPTLRHFGLDKPLSRAPFGQPANNRKGVRNRLTEIRYFP
jgi:hypothetical protein